MTNLPFLEKKQHIGKNLPGFTVAELLVTLSILFIILTIAIPAFSRWLPRIRLKGATREMYSNLQLARLNAIKENSNCVVAFIGDNEHRVFIDWDGDMEYDGNLSTDGIDNDKDGTTDEAGESDSLIKRIRWSESEYDDIRQSANFEDNDDGQPAIAFQPNGIPTRNSGGFANGTVTLININNNRQSRVTVNQAGRIRIL